MVRGNIELQHPERFAQPYRISERKIEMAIEKALDKLERDLPKWTDKFAGGYSRNYKYFQTDNKTWVSGMHTGLYWLAYEMSGNKKFFEVAQKHMLTYKDRFDKKMGMDDHDVGFAFTPSCIAAYKLNGDERIRQLVLDATEYYYRTSYSKKGGFILRVHTGQDEEWGCRTMMDTLMNAPLLFWSAKESGNMDYYDAALSQNRITEKYLIRDDGSSFHHYQFEPGTHKPVRGLTFQGYSDDSCWSRGHAWGIYGFPLAYSYTKEEFLVNLHKDITYYMLNHLPNDMIPYWDFIFTDGEQPRDSSAGAIAVCGMNEMCKFLKDEDPQKKIFESASAQMLEALIDQCTGDIGIEYDGIVHHVTAGVPQNLGIEECAIYGDYFYLEALMRYINPNWCRYW